MKREKASARIISIGASFQNVGNLVTGHRKPVWRLRNKAPISQRWGERKESDCSANNYGRMKHRTTRKLKNSCHYLSCPQFCIFTKRRWNRLYSVRSNSPHFQQVKLPTLLSTIHRISTWSGGTTKEGTVEVHKAPEDCYNAVITEGNIQYHCIML